MTKPLALGVLVSGRGSNLQAIINAIEEGKLRAEIKVVISDREEAYALDRARHHRIKTLFLDPRGYGCRESYDQMTAEALQHHGVQLVILAGFMRLLSAPLIHAFPHAIMNIHPSLLPAFPGLHVQRKALDHGVKFSGCTVHFVDEGLDSGPIIIQAVVPVLDGDTEETLSERILNQEHRIFPRAIELFAQGRLRVAGRRVLVNHPGDTGGEFLVNPSFDRAAPPRS
jgi:phosphoribosylglycinamide formyltransferase-1